MVERGITNDQVELAVYGGRTTNAQKVSGRSTYWTEEVGVWMNEHTRVVLAVLRASEMQDLIERSKAEVDVAAAKKAQLRAAEKDQTPAAPRRRYRKKEPEVPVQRSHVLDAVHPALRASITRLVDGDFSRIVVHSATKVDILPRS